MEKQYHDSIKQKCQEITSFNIVEILAKLNTRVNNLANNLRNELLDMFLLCSIKFDPKPYFFPDKPQQRLQAEHSSTRHVGHMHRYAYKNDFT